LSGGQVLARLNRSPADDAADRRDDRRVLQVELRLLERGRGLLDLRGRRLGPGSLNGNLFGPRFRVLLRCLRLRDARARLRDGLLCGSGRRPCRFDRGGASARWCASIPCLMAASASPLS
jgi:hypothetical protein